MEILIYLFALTLKNILGLSFGIICIIIFIIICVWMTRITISNKDIKSKSHE